MDRGPTSQCKLCGEVGHQTIGCHYHPSILEDRRVLNLKNQTNDFGKDMDMSYTKLTKKKEWRMVKVPILKDQMKQLIPKKEHQKVTLPTFLVLWVGLPSTIGGSRWGPQMHGMGPTM